MFVYFKWEKEKLFKLPTIFLVYKLIKQLRSETEEVLNVSSSHCLYSKLFLSFLSLFLCSSSPGLYIFSLLFFPSLRLQPPFLQPLQLPEVQTVFSLFLFLSPSLSQPGFLRSLRYFIFNCFLLFCWSACHCLCLFQPPPMGESFSFLWLNQSLPTKAFF